MTRLLSLVVAGQASRTTRYAVSTRLFATSQVTTAAKEKPDRVKKEKAPKKSFSDTLILPKTDFPLNIPSQQRNEHELNIAAKLQFDQLYGLQRLWRQAKTEYILHDGPPYANGNPHIGHAVNKILKDITNRYKLLRGYRVNYTPGWDCHGLPIELKILRDEKIGFRTNPADIRSAARNVADEAMKTQLEAFRRWGVMAEWNSPYRTLDKSYIRAELQIFNELYQKEFVYRDLKPIYWSPSSMSALAEAELEYNPRHESNAAYIAVDMCELSEFESKTTVSIPSDFKNSHGYKSDAIVKAIIWTTTPWTIPANKAIAYNPKEKYSLVSLDSGYERKYFILAQSLINSFVMATGKNLVEVLSFEGHQLNNITYNQPWFGGYCPFLPGDFVTLDKGTGLVHVAPAHGGDDYLLALDYKLPIDCYVDEKGNFDSTIISLKGKPVLTSGNASVLTGLGNKVLKTEKFQHPYPYDWRTKKPVIVKTSMQWFVDTEKLKHLAMDELKNIKIFPSNIKNVMADQLVKRPYWCISRQRSWGVPLPVLYHKETGEPLVSKVVIDRLCDLIELTGSVDCWWDVPISTLLQNDKLNDQYEKGKDIFDIWLDSGVSWHLLGRNVADLYLEGKDQFQGWFQSSLLTSVAVRAKSPYKNLYVHGFVVDADGKKMSKSLGNVIDPATIVEGQPENKIKALGADVLRWWTASQAATDGGNIVVSHHLLQLSEEGLQKLRAVLRYLVGNCNEAVLHELDIENVTYDELMYADQYMLNELFKFQKQITELYDGFHYHRVLMRALHFATTEVSAHYFVWIKDRLYCDFKESQSRQSTLFVLNQIYLTLAKTLAPVLPFLVEESYSHYSQSEDSIFKSLWFSLDNETWNNSQVSNLFDLVMDLRTSFGHANGSNNSKSVWIELFCNKKTFETLRILHPADCEDESDKCDSELCDILQVSGIDLQLVDDSLVGQVGQHNHETSAPPESQIQETHVKNIKFTKTPHGVSHSVLGYALGISKTPMMQCARCRRFCCIEGAAVCSRCVNAINRLEKLTSKLSPVEAVPVIVKSDSVQ